MGLFDKFAGKAKEATDKAKEAADSVKSLRQNAEQVLASAQELYDKTSEECKDNMAADFAALRNKVGTEAQELSDWAKTMPDKLKIMADDFNVDSMWDKLSKTAAKAGQELIVMVLTIYYAIESKIPGLKSDKKNGKQ